MKNTHHEGHEEHEGKKSTRKRTQVMIDKIRNFVPFVIFVVNGSERLPPKI